MKKKLIQIILALIIFLTVIPIRSSNIEIRMVLYIIAYLLVGLEVAIEAVRNIFEGELFDENFLMTVATIGAFCIGEPAEAIAVMLFYQIGELFQEYAVQKSRKSISNLMDIRPDYANVNRNGDIIKVKPEEVKIGENIVIKPGEKIPLDGIVIEGKSMLDTSALTGESVPRSVSINEEVLSGCINQNGVLTVQVTKEFTQSTVSKILDLVENASNKKSKSENFISKFAKYYTPIVVISALLLAIIPPIVLKDTSFSIWVYRALSFLVVSCPCALVMSIPLGFFGGIGGAAKSGILIKGSNYLEALSKTEIVVFDKTGTLTKGVFEVQKINAIDISEDELIKLVAHVESYSTHPIAMSIKKAYAKEIDNSIISNIKEHSGLGIEANIEGKIVLVGNSKLMKQNNIEYKESNEIGTILYVSVNSKYVGYILIADEIKKDVFSSIKQLKNSGIKQTIMLTGDRKIIGEKIASELEIDKVYTELLPSGKVEKMEELLKEKSLKGKLAFVGDGINDAPVLALSDIGIAMGGLGSDAAIEAADIVIMTDEPSKISNAIKISKKTLRVVKENIYFAIFVKVAVLILSAFGVADMWEAVFADVGVSFIAVLNSLRMLKVVK